MNINSVAAQRDLVADFQAAYIRCIDRDELEHWPDFFVDECHYCVTTAANVADGLAAGLIWANSQAMLQDRVSALRHANVYERQRYRHIVGLPTVSTNAASEDIEAETPFIVARIMHHGTTDLFMTGVYKDEFVQAQGRLRIKRRLVVLDSSRIDTLLAVPL